MGINNLSLRIAELLIPHAEVLFLSRKMRSIPYDIAVGDFFSHPRSIAKLSFPRDCVFLITINPKDFLQDYAFLKKLVEDFCVTLDQLSGESRIIYVSSASVYGTLKTADVFKFSESSTLNPSSAYGRSKALFENVVNEIFGAANRLTIFRPSNIFGPSKLGFRLHSSLLEALYTQASGEQKAVEIHNRGSVRDFVPVSYCASVIARACVIDSSEGSNRFFNLSSGIGHRVFDWVEGLIGDDRIELGQVESVDFSVLDNEVAMRFFNLLPADYVYDFDDLRTELEQFR